jgi:acetyltransferase-like isoleucine patch superfamily enzyme
MQATLLDPVNTKSCVPLTGTRKLADCLVANHPLKELISTDLQQAGFDIIPNESATNRTLHLPLDHWISVMALCQLARSEIPSCLYDKRGDLVAWKGGKTPDACTGQMVTEATCFRIRYPWDFLQLNEEVLAVVNNSEIFGDVSPLAQIDGHLHLGEGSVILPGVYIEGNVIIGRNCKIGPNAYIRGNTAISDNCVIGNSVEIKNSVVYSHTKIKHLSYVGDSIIGSHVNIGAGTIIANYRHDGTNHRSLVNGTLVNTGRTRFGAIIGDGVRIGINTSVYPGRKIGPGRVTPPNAIVIKDLMPTALSNGKSNGFHI